MYKLFLLIGLLPVQIFAQHVSALSKAELSIVYTMAISDFIKAAYKRNPIPFDTLYFGKHVNGQDDDFPDISLPLRIENTQVRVISPETGNKNQKERRSQIYINLFAWVNRSSAMFDVVVFSNGFSHLYDYKINYVYNTKQKRYELKKLEFKGPPFDK